jgi:hypothetical protein
MEDVTYQIHWLSFTVKAEREDAFNLYTNVFHDIFGPLEDLGNGGRGFKEIYHNCLEFKLYLLPKSSCVDTYWHIEIPGRACECIPNEYFLALGDYLESNFKGRYEYKRLDFAYDHVGFEPKDVEDAILSNLVRSLAKRESLVIYSSPFVLRDDGKQGTYTVSFGSNQSERMITVYNKRGHTRLEFQTRDVRANVVGRQLLLEKDTNDWSRIGLSHLRDFIDFDTEWWKIFVTGSQRAHETISRPRDIAMGKLVRWMDKQVSPALSVAVDVLPKAVMDSIIALGRKKRGSRYDLLLGTPFVNTPQNEE